jgi:hypothetical protein
MGQKVQLTDTAAHEFENSEAIHRRPVIRTPLDSESRNFWTEMAKNGTSWTFCQSNGCLIAAVIT